MQSNYENILSYLHGCGWDEYKLRSADNLLPLVATLIEEYCNGQQLKQKDEAEKLKLSYNELLDKHSKFMMRPDSFKKYWNEKNGIEN